MNSSTGAGVGEGGTRFSVIVFAGMAAAEAGGVASAAENASAEASAGASTGFAAVAARVNANPSKTSNPDSATPPRMPSTIFLPLLQVEACKTRSLRLDDIRLFYHNFRPGLCYNCKQFQKRSCAGSSFYG